MTAVVGAKDRATNKVNARVIKDTDKDTLQDVAKMPSLTPWFTPTTQRLTRGPRPA